MATIRAAEMALGQPFPPASAEMVSQGNFRAISTLMAPNRGGGRGHVPARREWLAPETWRRTPGGGGHGVERRSVGAAPDRGSAMIEFVNFHLVPGLVLGSIYALGAIGVTLTFGILRFANFAHGETMTLGAYFTLALIALTGLHPLLLVPVAMALTALAVLGMDRLFFRPLRHGPTIILVIASFGLMLMVRSLVQIVWGAKLQTFSKGIDLPWVLLDTLRIFPKHVVIIGAALGLMAAVHLLLSRTRAGKAMRAMADSPDLARLTGIDTERVIRTTWIVGAGLAAAAGALLAYDTHLHTNMGFRVLLPIFAAALLGGIGRPYGAMAGGLVIGMAEELSTYPWIGTEPLVPPGYKAGVAFAIMVAILIWRPSGLFRGRVF